MPPRKSKTASRSASRLETSETPQTEAASELEVAPEFRIVYKSKTAKKTNLKRKLHSNGEPQDQAADLQPDPFEGASLPSTLYRVEPHDQWLEARRYTRFTILTDTFEVGDVVFVKADDTEDPDPNAPITGWLAKVLEVRAMDPAHVYLRVFWMYRPEDLPGGRRPYHGQNEVIASNDMQIIDATCVEAKASVRRWQEQDDKNELLDGDELFWRQTLDILKNKRLSTLPRHCIDQMPCNPDKLLIQCTWCKKWLHDTCIEQAAVRTAYDAHNLEFPTSTSSDAGDASKKQKTKKGGARPKKAPPPISLANDVPTGLLFSAKITTRGAQTVVVVTDNRPGQKSKLQDFPLRCLLCKQEIEKDVEVGGVKGEE